jgi:hypothetical protein
MKLYKTPQFKRWARKNDLEDDNLCNAAREIAKGLYEADLGGAVFSRSELLDRGRGRVAASAL